VFVATAAPAATRIQAVTNKHVNPSCLSTMNAPAIMNQVKWDNRAENLEWMTIAENTLYGNEYGNGCRGERHGLARLTKLDVLHIRATCFSQADYRNAAAIYNCTYQNIYNIVHKKTWAHL